MMTSSDAELFGGTELAAVGEVVSAITLDSNVVILVGPGREHEFRIENEFTLENRDTKTRISVRYDPYSASDPVRENLTELSAIVNTRVLHARAYLDGNLELSFDDGSVITVNEMEHYEAWTYTFGNYILACPPGGFRA